jgi:hypothetical protein
MVRAARRVIDQARAAAARDDEHEVIANITVVTGPDADARLRAELAFWGHEPSPDLGVAGDEHAVAGAVRRLAEAGAGTVVLSPAADEPDPEGFVRFAAEGVRPLVP